VIQRRLRVIACTVVASVALLSGCSASTTVVPRQVSPSADASVPVPSPESLLVKEERTVLDQPIVYPTQMPAQVSSSIITLLPGQQTGPHRHDVPLYGFVLEGTLTVEYDGGITKEYRAGEALMEAIGTRHNGSNRGTQPVRILVTFIGAEGLENTVKF